MHAELLTNPTKPGCDVKQYRAVAALFPFTETHVRIPAAGGVGAGAVVGAVTLTVYVMAYHPDALITSMGLNGGTVGL